MTIAKYLLAGALLATASAAMADTRVFIVANHPDGYGIDKCLAEGQHCGASAARAYCEARQFKTASEYRRVVPDDVTSAVSTTGAKNCSDRSCAHEYVAITCER